MIGKLFVKSQMRAGNRRSGIGQIAIDAQRAWCKSQIFRVYSVLVRLNNGRHA
jgi:hypothetical protein